MKMNWEVCLLLKKQCHPKHKSTLITMQWKKKFIVEDFHTIFEVLRAFFWMAFILGLEIATKGQMLVRSETLLTSLFVLKISPDYRCLFFLDDRIVQFYNPLTDFTLLVIQSLMSYQSGPGIGDEFALLTPKRSGSFELSDFYFGCFQVTIQVNLQVGG